MLHSQKSVSFWCILSLCVLLSGLTFLLGAKNFASPGKAAPRVRAKPTLAYRVVELGRHRFLNQPLLPKDVTALLARHGARGFSLSEVNAHGDRIFNRDDAYPGSYFRQAYLSHGKVTRPLRAVSNLSFSVAHGINNHGDVVGASWDDDQSYTATLWRHGRAYALIDYCLGRWASNNGPSPIGRALAINDHGQIVAIYVFDDANADYFLVNPVASVTEPKRRPSKKARRPTILRQKREN